VSKSPIHNTPARILGLSADELEKIKEQFPYFNSARMLLLKQRQDAGAGNDIELSSSAVYSHDRKKLHDFLKKRNQPEVKPVSEPEKVEEPVIIENDTPDYTPVEQQELNPVDTTIIPQEEVIEQEVVLIEQEVEHIEEENLTQIEAEAPTADISAPVIEAAEIHSIEESVTEVTPSVETSVEETTEIESPFRQSPFMESQPLEPEEEEAEEEETSTVTLPEAKKFIIADHTFDEWLDHFKKGKHSVKRSIEDMPKAKEEAADELDRLIESSLPATFFHDKLESETQYAKGLENFIDVQKKKKSSVKKPAETGLVTETLAKIYERQGLVDKAISVYESLILKNPEKSAYFAVQIERLKNK
jgi:hypothetical protein